MTAMRINASMPLLGTFTVTVGGVASGPLPYNISTEALQATLQQLNGVNAISVSTAASTQDPILGRTLVVTFKSPTQNNIPSLSVNGAGLVRQSATVTTVRVTSGSQDLLLDPIPSEYLQVRR